MSSIEFEAWPKIPRLNREVVVTEKIDGTNSAVVIAPVTYGGFTDELDQPKLVAQVGDFAVFAQSRTRFITPEQDNYGFARWVKENASTLVAELGAGRHFGEWWGSGIQRKYGLTGGDKRFSLFNTGRWARPGDKWSFETPGLKVVPVLYNGPFNQWKIDSAVEQLRIAGSVAAPGFMRPEGVIAYHEALRASFKVTLEGDEKPKSVIEKELGLAA